MMKYLQKMLVLMAVVLINTTALADIPRPNIPKPNAEQCVEPTQEMRVNHMEYILHQRDDTVHEGIRTKQHSFKNCINCHVVRDESGQAVTFKDERHFCNSCHSYAAVKIDCFECHSSTPTNQSVRTMPLSLKKTNKVQDTRSEK